MKLFVLFALVAVAACQYVPGSDKEAQIVKNLYEAAVDNSFVTDVETSNGILVKAYGESLPGPEPETGTSRQSGSYQYVAPDGQTIRVEWEADERGYRATSDVIPEGADGRAAATGEQQF
ncbi:cuticle protein CP14.6-like [Amphibalanus amphitrite]|uniref:cuticle protein CP14.6-like n=1 Tax=Amphibalanus amphitrite TaxID=1232801 RepID=UPI001C8FD4D5|nr:cuticle protein CP14.6-like [Amphibalanus amphitrite]XP_043208142.1 cuticle protein CP14.6-like [Amphibalanus amphitrite]